MRNLLGIILVLGTFAAPGLLALARPWTDNSGTRTIEAEFVEFKNGTVVLKKEDGKTLRLPLAKFSAEDQEFVRSQLAPTASKDAASKNTTARDSADSSPASGGSAAKSAASAIKVHVLAMNIVKPVPDAILDPRGNDFYMSLGAYGIPGTHIRLLIQDSPLEIVGLDTKASKITSFTDDRKTNLAAQRPSGAARVAPIRFRATGEASKHAIVEIFQPGAPVPGATKVLLKGQLVLRCGEGEKSVEQKDVPLDHGSQITAGPFPLEIQNALDQKFGNANFTLVVSGNQPLESIKRIEFLDAAGQPLKSIFITSVDTRYVDNSTSYIRQYGLPERLDTATVRIVQFANSKNVTLPLNLEIGVGF